MVIKALGLRKAKGTNQETPRIATGIVRIPLLGEIVLGSIYGWTGVGPRGPNLELLTALPQIASANALPLLIGGTSTSPRPS